MCGIFGVVFDHSSEYFLHEFQNLTKDLFLLSESRGKEASGLALSFDHSIQILKSPLPAHDLLKTKEYAKLLQPALEKKKGQPISMIGHSRLVTTGHQENHFNNQPVIKHGMVVVHNGIIVNTEKLWQLLSHESREAEVDTEIVPALIHHSQKNGTLTSSTICELFRKIEGSASIALLFENYEDLLLASNTGSLYFAQNSALGRLIFASEKWMLKQLIKKYKWTESVSIAQISSGKACLINTNNLNVQSFDLFRDQTPLTFSKSKTSRTIIDLLKTPLKRQIQKFHSSTNGDSKHVLEDHSLEIDQLKRCTKCLLPATFPFIKYNESGVCNMCEKYKPLNYKGIDALKKLVKPFQKNNGEPDVVVSLSGGRDSTYLLHYLKTELGLNPVAYTYDWGMVTDLARRNISRITSKLGVEHILISADIDQKRVNIRNNINAWLKRPRLGTVPLFMAGDKQLWYYPNLVRKRMNIQLLFFGINTLERTDFKTAFCGFNEQNKEAPPFYLSPLNKLKIFNYYAKEFVLNPSFINSSLMDSLFAYFSYYIHPHDYHMLFDYIKWDEDVVTKTIIDEYQWETSPDTPTTWRIGDGTAAFYNYIYYTVAGFTESDTFRSNQIREGLISRQKGLEMVRAENKPRFESILWYCQTVGINFEQTIKAINAIPMLY